MGRGAGPGARCPVRPGADARRGSVEERPPVDVVGQEARGSRRHPGGAHARPPGGELGQDLRRGVAAADDQDVEPGELLRGAVVGGVQLPAGVLLGAGVVRPERPVPGPGRRHHRSRRHLQPGRADHERALRVGVGRDHLAHPVGAQRGEAVPLLVRREVVDDVLTRWEPLRPAHRHHPAGQRGVRRGREQPQVVPHPRPRAARSLAGVDEDEVLPGHQPDPLEVVADGESCLAGPHDRHGDVEAVRCVAHPARLAAVARGRWQ